MTRYTARNGTTFLFDPAAEESVQVAGADDHVDGQSLTLSVDLDDLREFVQYLEAGLDVQAPNDADCAAVGPD
jgi:hypothetical protein